MTGRIQLALNVDDLGESIAFYSKLFGAEPAKVRPGYANFAVAEPPLKLVLLENPGQGGRLNHLGVEVADTGAVESEQARLAGAGLASIEEKDTTCCYARQDKFWVEGAPDGERWEIYTVLEDSPAFWGQDGSQSRDAAAAELDAAPGAGPAQRCCGPSARARLPGQAAGLAVRTWRGAGGASAVFIAAQAGGGIAGLLIIRYLYPALTPAQAAGVVVPHETENGSAADGDAGRAARLPHGTAG